MEPPVLTILSDFGTRDGYAGIMKGVILSICPDACCVDLTHDIPPQDVTAGALVLRSAVGYFPRRTTHLAVVDPGVGSARAPIVVSTEGGTFVGPDNGLLFLAVQACGGPRGIWRIERAEPLRQPVSHTFHGRDVFAPAAARLAAGVPPDQLGAPLTSLRQLALPVPRREHDEVRGEVIYVDHFGNLVTNISAQDVDAFASAELSVSIGPVSAAPLVNAYAQVARGEPLAILNSWGMLEVAVREGNAARELGVAEGAPVAIAAHR
jgi:S-adenosylmethionine hydrolase